MKVCDCAEHINATPLTQIPGHEFHRQEDMAGNGEGHWRWRCRCGGHGQWQGQSPSVVYHQWLRHIERSLSTA